MESTCDYRKNRTGHGIVIYQEIVHVPGQNFNRAQVKASTHLWVQVAVQLVTSHCLGVDGAEDLWRKGKGGKTRVMPQGGTGNRGKVTC